MNCAGCGCSLYGEGKFKPFARGQDWLCLPCLSEEGAAKEASNKVVSILKARPVVGQNENRKMWVCGDCNGQWFWLYGDGSVQCAGCDTEQRSIRTFLPEEKP